MAKKGRKKEKYLRRRGGIWWIKIPRGGGMKPLELSTNVPANPLAPDRVPEEATAFRDLKLTEIRKMKERRINPTLRKVTVNELLDDYVNYLRLKAAKTVDGIIHTLDSRLRPAFGKMEATELTSDALTEYRNTREAAGKSPTTVNRHFAYLRAAYVNAWKRQMPRKISIEQVPWFPMADESGNVRNGYVEEDGYQRILAELPKSIQPYFICAYHVSSRYGELINITWDQVDFRAYLDPKTQRYFGMIVLDHADTKNGHGRYLPIYGDMIEALRKQKDLRDSRYPETNRVFFWHEEDVVNVSGASNRKRGEGLKRIRWAWKSAVERAGFPELLIHDLRRSATRNMTKAGIDQVIRMKVSGHLTTQNERRYNITDLEDIARAAVKMETYQAARRSEIFGHKTAAAGHRTVVVDAEWVEKAQRAMEEMQRREEEARGAAA